MKFRRSLFRICLVFSIVLFIQGLYTLNIYNTNDDQFYSKYTPIEIIRNSMKGPTVNRNTNLLLLGLDDEEVRSDVIALVNYNPAEEKINILSIARDTRVKVGGKYVKINALIGKGGEKLIAQKVEEITGLNIDYYMTLNFKGFREIVDVMGGVEIDVPFDMDYDDPEQELHIHLKKGKQILDGEKAEQFVRYRKGNHKGEGYDDGDIGRIKAQQIFLKEFINQKLKVRYILRAGDIFSILKNNIKTNIEVGDINSLIKEMNKITAKEVRTFTLPGYSAYKNKAWYYIFNEKKTKELIEDNFYY